VKRGGGMGQGIAQGKKVRKNGLVTLYIAKENEGVLDQKLDLIKGLRRTKKSLSTM
jgi:hypothetical protein